MGSAAPMTHGMASHGMQWQNLGGYMNGINGYLGGYMPSANGQPYLPPHAAMYSQPPPGCGFAGASGLQPQQSHGMQQHSLQQHSLPPQIVAPPQQPVGQPSGFQLRSPDGAPTFRCLYSHMGAEMLFGSGC